MAIFASRTLAFAALAASTAGAIAFYGSRSVNLPRADTVGPLARDAQSPPSDASPLAESVEVAPTSPDEPVAQIDAIRTQDPVRQSAPPQPSELALQGIQLPPPLLEAESTFAAEPIDPLWASQTEAHILREIAALSPRPMFTLQVECRSTICRLQVVEPDSAPLDRRMRGDGMPESVAALVGSTQELVVRSGLESRGAMSVHNRSGSRVLVAYFARETPDADVNASIEPR